MSPRERDLDKACGHACHANKEWISRVCIRSEEATRQQEDGILQSTEAPACRGNLGTRGREQWALRPLLVRQTTGADERAWAHKFPWHWWSGPRLALQIRRRGVISRRQCPEAAP